MTLFWLSIIGGCVVMFILGYFHEKSNTSKEHA